MAAPKVTTAVRSVVNLTRGSSAVEQATPNRPVSGSTPDPAPSPGARAPHSSPPPKGPDAKNRPPGTKHREKRAAALEAVELPSFKLTDEPTEDDAKLAVVALLKAGVLKQNTRGKAKGKITLDVAAANDLVYTPTTDEGERGLRQALEGMRTYGGDPWKPNSAEIKVEHGKAYHENSRLDQPLRANLRGDMKIGAMMASLIEKANAGQMDLLGIAQSEKKVTREDLAAQEARLAEIRALEPELIAAKEQITLPDGHREDRSTWKPPDFIKIAGKEGLSPRPWQSGACAWAEKANRGIVGLDMGMGKTAFAIMDFANRKAKGRADQALVFAEVNQIYGWKE